MERSATPRSLSRSQSPEIPVQRTIQLSGLSIPRSVPSENIVYEDISNGLELYPIRVLNDVNDAKITPFKYIKGIEMFENYQRQPVVCDCEDGCDTNCKCMFDAFDNSYCDIPYHEKTGRLAVKFKGKWASGHRVLWECSEACQCGQDCPSRSAQLGCRFQLEVFQTEKKGWGVRSRRDIPEGSFISEYAGQMQVAKDDLYEYNENDWYSFDITSELGETNFYIDASSKGNLSRFINHSCDPNLIAVHVFYDDNNPQMGMHICFYASRNIEAMEELSFDYGSHYWEAKKAQKIGCECLAGKGTGRSKCLYRITPKKGAKRNGRKKGGLKKKAKAAEDSDVIGMITIS